MSLIPSPTLYRVEDLPAEIASRIVVNLETGCWEWQHKTLGDAADHYGSVFWDGSPQPVHRVTYNLLVGAIPADRPHLDHVYDWGCRARSCCWPTHLDPVTPGENLRRMWLASAKRRRDLAAVTADPDDLVGMAEVVKITGYSRTTLDIWRREGEGPPTRLTDWRRVARRGDVLDWLARYDNEHLIRRLAA
jgi:predicted DNA-binding transcriptional regulator AlpA